MELYTKVFPITIFAITFNMLVCYKLIIDKFTGYPGNTQGDIDVGYLWVPILLFGPFMFLFLKRIRLYRKHRYLKKRINYYLWSHNPMELQYKGGHDNPMQPEIDKLSRILKISLIHQQAKRNKIKKMLWQW